jgi:hypothetical protein
MVKTLRHVRRHALVGLLALGLIAALVFRLGATAGADPKFPQDGQMEAALGIRFTQAAVVADGGLIEVRYVVLNTEKASAFQNDTKHPPTLTSESNGKVSWRAALMKQGHELRAGQSYYILYLNNQGSIKRGDKLTIDAGSRKLAHVPVK